MQSLLADEDPSFTEYIVFNNTPLTYASMCVYNEFNDLLNTLTEMDKTGTDWYYKLRTFTLPRTDKSLIGKENYVMSKTARSFGEKIDEQLQLLAMFPQLLI